MGIVCVHVGGDARVFGAHLKVEIELVLQFIVMKPALACPPTGRMQARECAEPHTPV